MNEALPWPILLHLVTDLRIKRWFGMVSKLDMCLFCVRDGRRGVSFLPGSVSEYLVLFLVSKLVACTTVGSPTWWSGSDGWPFLASGLLGFESVTGRLGAEHFPTWGSLSTFGSWLATPEDGGRDEGPVGSLGWFSPATPLFLPQSRSSKTRIQYRWSVGLSFTLGPNGDR